jgi:hypothetical protein
MTRDQTPNHNTIPIESLAARVARAVCRFLQVSSLSGSFGHFFVRLRPKQEAAGQQGNFPDWSIGRITANDIILVGLLHVTQGSWQPILQLNRYVISQSSRIR